MQSPRITCDQPGETEHSLPSPLLNPGATLFSEDNNFSMPFIKKKKAYISKTLSVSCMDTLKMHIIRKIFHFLEIAFILVLNF